MSLGLPSQRGRLLLVRDAHLPPYAGLLVREVRSAAGLEAIIADQLGLPVRVEPFRRRRLPIAPAEHLRLGLDAVAGARTPDDTSTFRVVVGPVDDADVMALEPRGRRMAELVELVRLTMDPGLDFDVQVVLRRADVPESRLGPGAPRLGWTGGCGSRRWRGTRGRRCMGRRRRGEARSSPWAHLGVPSAAPRPGTTKEGEVLSWKGRASDPSIDAATAIDRPVTAAPRPCRAGSRVMTRGRSLSPGDVGRRSAGSAAC